MTRGFEARKRYSEIARELAALGFRVCERTVARRGREWLMERRRREALGLLGTAGSAQGAWRFDEMIALTEDLDLSPGWYHRASKAIHKMVADFLEHPTDESARTLQMELVRYRLSALVLSNSAGQAAVSKYVQTEDEGGSL
jgi:hypothetical protein